MNAHYQDEAAMAANLVTVFSKETLNAGRADEMKNFENATEASERDSASRRFHVFETALALRELDTPK